MKTNTTAKDNVFTHENAVAKRITAEQELRRTVLACMLWERNFYESGESVADRIVSLVAKVKPEVAASIAIEARNRQKLRHVPLLIVRAMSKLPEHKALVADTLYEVIQRADELSEFLSLYWGDKRQPISAQVRKGLKRAFLKFNAYQLAKYNRDAKIKLRDVLFLVHAKPLTEEQAECFAKLASNTLESPDTWEVALSASQGENKKEIWARLLTEKKLGALALLRNLRNMLQSDVDISLIRTALSEINTERVLPFRFIAAAKVAPSLESDLETAMIKCLANKERLSQKTLLLIDVSASMHDEISAKSDLSRLDAACGLAILARELCENISIFTFSMDTKEVPARHGFALRDAIVSSQRHSGTYLGAAIKQINETQKYDRIIVLTDEQTADKVPNPISEKAYIINVASYKNGVGYGRWAHIDGWAESVLDYIVEFEQEEAPVVDDIPYEPVTRVREIERERMEKEVPGYAEERQAKDNV